MVILALNRIDLPPQKIKYKKLKEYKFENLRIWLRCMDVKKRIYLYFYHFVDSRIYFLCNYLFLYIFLLSRDPSLLCTATTAPTSRATPAKCTATTKNLISSSKKWASGNSKTSPKSPTSWPSGSSGMHSLLSRFGSNWTRDDLYVYFSFLNYYWKVPTAGYDVLSTAQWPVM